MCDCVKNIKEALKEQDANLQVVDFELDNVYSVGADGKKQGNACTGQPVILMYQIPKKRSEGFRFVNRKSFIAHMFCPFCGVKYSDDVEQSVIEK